MTRPAIAELVFAAAAPPPPRRHQAIVVTALIHLGVAAAILGAQPTLETWSAEMAARVHDELTRLQLADVETLPPPPVEPPPEPPPSAPAPAVAAVAPASDPPRSAPARPAPARAARVVASPPGALDLTGDVVVTGHASAYAGGVTTSTGTSARPVPQASREPAAPPGAPPRGVERPPAPTDRSRPVSLAGDEWNCPWPDAAEGLALDEQTAVIRVRVAVDGSVESAEVVSDPGNGFGPAALSCARRTRFTPALDASGRPIAARSPPIRVHFHRDR